MIIWLRARACIFFKKLFLISNIIYIFFSQLIINKFIFKY